MNRGCEKHQVRQQWCGMCWADFEPSSEAGQVARFAVHYVYLL